MRSLRFSSKGKVVCDCIKSTEKFSFKSILLLVTWFPVGITCVSLCESTVEVLIMLTFLTSPTKYKVTKSCNFNLLSLCYLH